MERAIEVRVRGRGVRLTEQTRAYAAEKVVRSARFFARLGDVDVNVVAVDHSPDADRRFRAEISTRSVKHGVRAEGHGSTVEQALDAAADRFGSQLRRLGERLTERRRQRPRIPARADGQGEGLRRAQESGETIPEIVRTRRSISKPMTPEDAALVMGQKDYSFFLFTNTETSRFGILYQRKDGRLGLIEPE